jgi:mycothiol synthase
MAKNGASMNERFTLRPARWEDAEEVTQLMYEVCEADGDATVAATVEEVRAFWSEPTFNLATDTWLAVTPEGRIIGYEELYTRRPHINFQGDGYVHPQFKGQGVGSALLAALDAHIHSHIPLASPEMRVFCINFMDAHDKDGRAIHEELGFRTIRYNWRMEITLPNAPEPVSLPNGLELRPYIPGAHDEAIYEAEQESFADHWGHIRVPYDTWRKRKFAPERFDPALWHVAWDGEQIAGFAQCRYQHGLGWVGTLGVRRPWRKQGLGYALLIHAFRDFYQRGQPVIALGVDASNPTGATRLYERAGMKIASEFVAYEKEYRPGLVPEEEDQEN